MLGSRKSQSLLEIIVGLTDKTKGGLGTINGNLQKLGKLALGAAAGGVAALGVGMLTLGKDAIEAGSNLNEALNASSVVFQDSAKMFQDFAANAAETTGLSAESFNQMGAQLGAMLENFGLDNQQAAQSTIDLTQRAADMASIFNTDVSDAFGAVQAGLRGETEPLRRFGVDLSDAAVRAYAVSAGLAKNAKDIDNNTLMYARMGLLMQQTNTIAGDFVNTSDGLANSARIQAARWQNFKAEFGTKLLPVVQRGQALFMDIAEKALPKVLKALEPVFYWIDRVSTVFTSFVKNLQRGEPFMDMLSLAFVQLFGLDVGKQLTAISQKIKGVFDSVSQFLSPLIRWVQTNISLKDLLIALGVVLASVILPIIGSIIAAVAPLILTAMALIAVIHFLRLAWENDWNGMRTKITQFVQQAGAWITGQLVPWLQVAIPKAIAFLKQAWETVLKPALEAVGKFIVEKVIPALSDIVTWLATNIPPAVSTVAGFWNDTLHPALYDVWNFIYNKILPVFSDIWDWLSNKVPQAISTVKGFWSDTLLPALKDVWSFMSGDLWTVFQDIYTFFRDTFEAAINGIATAFDGVKQAIQWVIDKVTEVIDWFKKVGDSIPDWLIPGSPTPFETGLRGIGSALKELGNMPTMSITQSAAGAVGAAGDIYIESGAFPITAGAGMDEQALATQIVGQLMAQTKAAQRSGSVRYGGQ